MERGCFNLYPCKRLFRAFLVQDISNRSRSFNILYELINDLILRKFRRRKVKERCRKLLSNSRFVKVYNFKEIRNEDVSIFICEI